VLQNAEATSAREVSYVIDLERCRLLRRSPEQMLLQRRCPACRARLEEASKPRRPETHIRDIARCCSRKEDFITPDMPLLEIVYRTLLAAGNKPVRLRELHHRVTQEWATPSNPKNVSLEDLRRILDSDTYYGFAAISQEPSDVI